MFEVATGEHVGFDTHAGMPFITDQRKQFTATVKSFEMEVLL